MPGYTQLTQEQRYQIHALQKSGFKQNQIAAEVQVHKSTISRELRRNARQRGYRPQQAQHLAVERLQERACRPRISPDLLLEVEAKLREQWSPEQISGRLAFEQGSRVSHERIYQ